MKRFLLLAALCALLCLAAACGEAPDQTTPQTPDQTTQNDAPDAASTQPDVFDELYGMDKQWFTALNSVDLNGNAVDASLFADYDLTLVTFWATWCGYCINEMPDLQEIADEYADQGVQVLGVLVDFQSADGLAAEDVQEEAREILSEINITYRNLADCGFLRNTAFTDITSVPHAYFVDANGRFLYSAKSGSQTAQISGARTKEAWVEMIEELLAEQEA